MAPPGAARCARHSEVSAVDVCQRCGTFICGECANIRNEDVYCPDCAKLLDRPGSKRPKVAFALAAAPTPLATGVFLLLGSGGAFVVLAGLLLTPVAVVLLVQERAARRRGQSPAGGPFYALGWLAVAWNLFNAAVVFGLVFWNLLKA